MFGDLDTHDAHCRRMVNRTGWAVLAVHYRRAPEHALPGRGEDADAVAVWLRDQARTIWRRSRHHAAVSGDSAGANLALGVALRHPDPFEAQVLVYPFLDPSCETYDRNIPEPDFEVDALAWFWRLYLRRRRPGDADLDPLLAATSPACRPRWSSWPSSTCSPRPGGSSPSGWPPTGCR